MAARSLGSGQEMCRRLFRLRDVGHLPCSTSETWCELATGALRLERGIAHIDNQSAKNCDAKGEPPKQTGGYVQEQAQHGVDKAASS